MIAMKSLHKSNRGGKRPGAGRKPLGETKMIHINLVMAEEHIEQARAIGEGNLSAGIRKAIEYCAFLR